MRAKFKKGDRVVIKRLNPRTPKYVRDAVKMDNFRTIVEVKYNKRTGHNEYYVGFNWRGADISMYPFRASELRYPTQKVGRPLEKRKYTRKVQRH